MSFESIKAGLYHYLREDGDERIRIHLRVEPDEYGTLLINANRVLNLNPTAAFMTRLLLDRTEEQEAINTITKRYRISSKQAKKDYKTFNFQLKELIKPDGACPIHDIGLETSAPFSAQPTAPYRMDLAITYRCNNNCSHCYNQRNETDKNQPHKHELSTDEWKRIIDKLWEIGIPHIVFTGGEPTLRSDLVELVGYAQSKGQVTGLNTNARRLSNPDFVKALVEAGLDHVQITLESHIPELHDRMVSFQGAWEETVTGIKNALTSRLFVMTNTTLLTDNAPHLSDTLDFLGKLGIPTVGLNALIYSGRGVHVGTGIPENDLPPLLKIAKMKTESSGQRLIWYTPTQYCHFDPVLLDLGVKGCTAARYNMCIEPDGSVIPCQSYYKSLGNMLSDPWDEIWNHDLAVYLRERKYVPKECLDCGLLPECGGGCPLVIYHQTQTGIQLP